jgi:hypothetical protein
MKNRTSDAMTITLIATDTTPIPARAQVSEHPLFRDHGGRRKVARDHRGSFIRPKDA